MWRRNSVQEANITYYRSGELVIFLMAAFTVSTDYYIHQSLMPKPPNICPPSSCRCTSKLWSKGLRPETITNQCKQYHLMINQTNRIFWGQTNRQRKQQHKDNRLIKIRGCSCWHLVIMYGDDVILLCTYFLKKISTKQVGSKCLIVQFKERR